MKNMDPLNDNVTDLLHNSTETFVATIWKDSKPCSISCLCSNKLFFMLEEEAKFSTRLQRKATILVSCSLFCEMRPFSNIFQRGT